MNRKCPLCGMTLVAIGNSQAHTTHQHAESNKEKSSHNESANHSYDKHQGHHTGDFLKRFWISLIVTVPILFLSHTIQQWVGLTLGFKGDSYVLLLWEHFIYLWRFSILRGMMGKSGQKPLE